MSGKLVKYVKKAVRRARRAPRKSMSGRGFYKGFGKHLGQAIGGTIGAFTGLPMSGMSSLGGALGKYGSKFTGFGSYKYQVKRNTLLSPDPPMIANRGREGAVQIRHREFVCDVTSSDVFQIVATLPLNAGQAITFPWLSNIARNFSQYELNGCIVEFVTSSGNATGANTALGNLMISSQYDTIQPPFSSKVQMLNEIFSSTTVPSSNQIHPIECARNQSSVAIQYVRTGVQPANTDIRMYDLATTYIGFEGGQTANNGQVVGSIYINYDVLLYKPSLPSSLDSSPTLRWTFTETGSAVNDTFKATLGFPILSAPVSYADLYNPVTAVYTIPAGFVPDGCGLVATWASNQNQSASVFGLLATNAVPCQLFNNGTNAYLFNEDGTGGFQKWVNTECIKPSNYLEPFSFYLGSTNGTTALANNTVIDIILSVITLDNNLP